MKPDWKDAPKWANYLAMDGNGSWYWHEDLPLIDDVYHEWNNDKRVSAVNISWKDTLKKR